MLTASRNSVPAWALAVAVVAAYMLVTVNQLRAKNWDITAFIVAGDVFVDRSHLDSRIAILPNSPGYDGQFYYRLGLDPFTSQRTAHGITIDDPATRGVRILFPLLSWAASMGKPAALPWAMLGVNLAGLFALAWMGVAVARRHGAPDWMGLLPAFYSGFIVTLIRDTTEIVGVAFLFAAALFALRNRAWYAALFASIAILARETTLLTLAGFGIVELARCIRARRASAALFAYLIPPIVFAAWQLVVRWHWNLTSFSGNGGQDLGPPLLGLISFFSTTIHALRSTPEVPPDASVRTFWLLAAAMCVSSFTLFLIVAARGRAPSSISLSWALYAVLMLCFTTAIWIEPYAFLRACTEGFVLGSVMVILSRERTAAFVLLALTLPIWLLSAYRL